MHRAQNLRPPPAPQVRRAAAWLGAELAHEELRHVSARVLVEVESVPFTRPGQPHGELRGVLYHTVIAVR